MKLRDPAKARRSRNTELCPFLKAVADQMAPSIRAGTERALRKLERRGIKSRTLLKKYIVNLPERELSTALWVLGRVGQQSDVPKLMMIRRSRPKTAVDALEALSMLGGKRARSEIVRSLGDQTQPLKVRIAACHALGHRWQGKVRSSIFYPFINNLEEDASLRGYAIESVGLRVSREATNELNKAVALLLPCLDDQFAEVRFWAVFALAAMGAEQALPKLRRLARKDRADGPFGWSVAEEAKDAVHFLTNNGRWPELDASERRLRKMRTTTGTNSL